MNLSWSEQLDSLLNATDGNVARIKVRGSEAPVGWLLVQQQECPWECGLGQIS